MADSPKNSGAAAEALRQAEALAREKPAARPRLTSHKNKAVPDTLTDEEYEACRERLMIDNAWCAFALLGGLICGGVAIYGAVRSFNPQVFWVAAVCVLIILFGLAAMVLAGGYGFFGLRYNRRLRRELDAAYRRSCADAAPEADASDVPPETQAQLKLLRGLYENGTLTKAEFDRASETLLREPKK